jgi:hypothetical protein
MRNRPEAAVKFVGGALLAAFALSCLALNTQPARAQAALLLEQPYGVFGTLNPTGHAAIYLAHVCAATPVQLRRCRPDEPGSVISRYKGLDGYDWIAVPLIPYLYSVETQQQVPQRVDQETVNRLRQRYKEAHFSEWDRNLPKGNFFYGGWTELVGTAYDRRTYAFRFDTTPEQDEKLIAKFNTLPNHSHFNLLFNNCADFDRLILKEYFPGKFNRTIFPDAGITTPKRLAYGLVQYAKKHPEMQLAVLEIPQVPGYRRHSHAVHGVAESIITNGYVIPIVILNPYVAGGLLADYLVRGRYHLIPKNPPTAGADHLDALIGPSSALSRPPGTQRAADPSAAPSPVAKQAGMDHAVALPVSGETDGDGHLTQTGAPAEALEQSSPQSIPQSSPE